MNNMAQTTNATKFEEMCEEVPWGETTLMRAYSQWSGMRCSVCAHYNEQQCVLLSNAWNKWLMKQDGSGEHIVEFESDDNKNGSLLLVRIDLNKMVQTTSATNFAMPRCVVRLQNLCPSL